MKLTKEQEAEIWQVYDTWLTAYLNADVKTYNAYFDDDYHFIGSTINEEFLNRNDATTFFKQTGEQFAGIMDLRNEIKILEIFDTSIFITHFCDVWFINDEGRTYYGRFRLSSVMQKKSEGWHFIYQHFSMPDSKSDEGETIGFEKINAENVELKEAIKRRTIELETKNRELEIEAALERVRAQSMAMQQPDDLNKVNKELLAQLKGLKIDGLTGVSIWLLDGDGMVTAWDLSSPGNMRNPSSAMVQYNPEKFDILGEPWRLLQETDDDYFVLNYAVEKLEKAINEWAEVDRTVANGFREALANGDLKHQWNPIARHSNGILSIDLINPPLGDTKEIVTKMASAFSLAYTRFLDLQKAEAQAREAQIEMALEKVRSRTMAMQSSDELTEAASEMFSQIKGLGLNPWSCGFNIFKDDKTVISQWVSTGDGRPIEPFDTPATEGIFKRIVEQSENDEPLYIEKMEGKKLEDTYKYMASLPTLDKIFEELDAAGIELPKKQVDHAAYFKHGYLMFITYEETPEFHSIYKRFANVFEQTYTRFLDLQKAEAQTREAKIEAALEKVRSRSLAMQKSDDLLQVITELSGQLRELNVRFDFVSFGVISPKNDIDFWMAGEGVIQPELFYMPFIDNPITTSLLKAQKQGQRFFESIFDNKDTKEWMGVLHENNPGSKMLAESKDITLNGPGLVRSSVILKNICVFMGNFRLKKHSKEQNTLLVRFANAFDQAYTRFLDLKRAEAQAREAQIETALEKIRSRTMAMQKGDELQEVAVLLYKELIALGVTNFVTCGYVEVNEDIQRQHTWVTAPGGDTMGLFHLPLTGDATFDERYAAWKSQQTVFHQSVAGQQRSDHLEYAITTFNSKEAEEMVRSQFPDPTVFYCFNFSHGYLHTVGGSLLEKEEENLLARFTKVFEQTYTRFLDLQKAEEQAREAKIEMSLEKIRSRTMGMQNSEELPEVANMLFLEVQELGIPAWSCGYCILTEDRRASTCIMSSEGTVQKPFLLPHLGEPSFEEWDDFVHGDQTFFTQELKGEAIDSHYNFMKSLPQLKPVFQDLVDAGLTLPAYQINHLCKFSHGFLLFITYEEVPGSHDIFKRFTSVFEQTYTRFLDLKKSEKRAREAEVDLSLERVRSQVTAMQASSDLFDIVVNMRKEFVSLGYTADYFWHMRWLPDVYEMSMTSEDGNRLGMVINVPKFVHDQIPGLAKWEKGSDPTYVLALNAEESWDYIDNMNKHGDYKVVDPNAPTREDIEHIGGLTFIIARTSHGEIGYSLPGMVPNPPNDAIDTLVRLAGVFDLAYKRFEDLQESEQQAQLILEERDRLEVALKELHATQDQLVQQEKLASLGQLTAGIAHEIKNPLNFVNNFSDVSIELVEEARDEVKRQKVKVKSENSPLTKGDKGGCSSPQKQEVSNDDYDPELILEILDDIEANLRKVYEHGSRADGIVKSMLQHSRGGDGKPEPVNLNALVNEYVNLSFHGMRAGKEPINVDIDLQLDDSIGEIPLVAEDFSRVILNLCNNGFDAMREKLNEKAKVKSEKSLRQLAEGDGVPDGTEVGDDTELGYVPKLTVRTKSSANAVTIEIEDNGPGIPDDIKDKILQPFFTTKKGTQGTGLGLSITNDIIKAHGGRMDVNSSPGKGTTFMIHLDKQGQNGF